MALLDFITLGDIIIGVVDADPNAAITAAKGSFVTDKTNNVVWQNTNGATAWGKRFGGLCLLEEIVDFKVEHLVGTLTELTELEDIPDFKANIVTQSLTELIELEDTPDFKADIVTPSLTKP